MNMLVSAAAVATASPLAATVPDPVFAAIEKHRQACEALSIEILKTDELEELPKEMRKSNITAWEEEIVETDDPRWIAHQKALQACNRAEDEATCELAELVPTSAKGALALLEYTAKVESRGCAWPALYENETDKLPRSFLYFVSRNLVESLRALAA
jgi:hypothetical protein